MKPETYNKYYINIEPPAPAWDGEYVKQDVVLAKDEHKAIEIMKNQYDFGPHKRNYVIVEVSEIELFRSDYQNIGGDHGYEYTNDY